MKRMNNLYNSVTDIDNIIKMTNKVLSRTRNKKKVEIKPDAIPQALDFGLRKSKL